MASQHEALSIEDLKDIQAGPVVPIPTRSISFLFFGIRDAPKFRELFGKRILSSITTSENARGMRSSVNELKNEGQMSTLAAINVSFSQAGLSKLLPDADTKDPLFKGGQLTRAQDLGDDQNNWLPNFTGSLIHGLFEVTGHPDTHVQQVMRDEVKNALGDSITVIFEHSGNARPGSQKNHEHFGFNDGIAQPFVKFEDDDSVKRTPLPGQTVVNPGVLLLGKNGDPARENRPSWALNGSFLVYRHLKQRVPEFDQFLKEVVLKSIITPSPIPEGFTDTEDFKNRVDFLGARLMGRWKSGMPVVLSPKEPGKFPRDNRDIGTNPELNNKFDYGPRDSGNRQQFLCPFAAHTRKTGPRTDLPQGAIEQHAIQRAGITFGPELTDKEKLGKKTLEQRGLSFVCYQSSLTDGFEFIQRRWSNTVTFPPRTGDVIPGFDPIIGQKNGENRQMTGYDAENLTEELEIDQEFVVAQGGEYFFLPSMTTLKTIAVTGSQF